MKKNYDDKIDVPTTMLIIAASFACSAAKKKKKIPKLGFILTFKPYLCGKILLDPQLFLYIDMLKSTGK
jgi:hypothetical protein